MVVLEAAVTQQAHFLLSQSLNRYLNWIKICQNGGRSYQAISKFHYPPLTTRRLGTSLGRQTSYKHGKKASSIFVLELKYVRRYLYLKLLLFRPFFTQKSRLDQVTRMAGASSLESSATAFIVSDCQYRCVQAAQSIVDLIANNLTTMSKNPQQDVLPSWWFTISCRLP